MALWHYHEVLRAVGQQPNAAADMTDFAIGGLSIDTRTLQPGDMFIALNATRDGHDFVPQAAEKGASCVLVSKPVPPEQLPHTPQIVVPDVLEALQQLAVAARERSVATRIAITGSCGKSTTKELLAAALGAQTHKTFSSYNNHWGVPLTLALLPKEAPFAVFEIGTNHPGEIAPLSRLVQPHVSVLMNVEKSHIGNFVDMDALAKEKLDIAAGLLPEGALILHEKVAERFATLLPDVVVRKTFALESDTADVTANEHEGHVHGQKPVVVSYHLALTGRYNSENSLACLAVMDVLGFAADAVQQGANRMAQVVPLAGRGQVLAAGKHTIVDESWNANPSSMLAAFSAWWANSNINLQRVVVVGDMRELGDTSVAEHAAMGTKFAEIVGENNVPVIAIGPYMRHFVDSYCAALPQAQVFYADSMQNFDWQKMLSWLAPWLQSSVKAEVWVKASKGSLYIHNFVPTLQKMLQQAHM